MVVLFGVPRCLPEPGVRGAPLGCGGGSFPRHDRWLLLAFGRESVVVDDATAVAAVGGEAPMASWSTACVRPSEMPDIVDRVIAIVLISSVGQRGLYPSDIGNT